MRYQLRYIRAQRTRSSPGAKHDDSPLEWARTNFLAPSGAPLSAAHAARSAETPARANLRRRSPLGAGPVAQWESVRFTRGRSLVRSQPGPLTLSQLGPITPACRNRHHQSARTGATPSQIWPREKSRLTPRIRSHIVPGGPLPAFSCRIEQTLTPVASTTPSTLISQCVPTGLAFAYL